MNTRLSFVPVLAAVAALALAGCSTGGGNSPASGDAPSGGQSASAADATSEEDALAALQASGVLKVGTEGTYAPFTFHDPQTSELTGYDVEVITAVAEKLGVKPEFSEVKWDGIFAGLESKRYDVIANQVAVTPEREAIYEFSTPYAVSTPVVIVKSDNTDITTVEDVTGKQSAQSVTSNWAELATNAGATVVGVDGFTEAVAAVRDGRVATTFNDNLAALEYFKTTGDKSVKVALEVPGERSEQALAARQGSGLAAVLTTAIEELRAEGVLESIGKKYFDADISG